MPNVPSETPPAGDPLESISSASYAPNHEVLAVLEELHASIVAVSVAMVEISRAIRDDVGVELRSTRRAQWPILGMLMLLVVLALTNFVILRQGNETLDRTRQTSDLIYDCTHVEGQCSQTNAKSTAGAVGRINAEINETGQQTTDEVVRRLECIMRTNVDCPAATTTTTTAPVG